MRTNTYFPKPGLYQIATGERVYLIDPQAICSWQPLIDVFQDPHVTKIMHACQEDLELIFHHLGTTLRGVFDTQYAHAFVSEDFSLSYVNLVGRRLGVTLEQHETRSNWLQRPLTDQQISYAVEDVAYLESLFQSLRDALQQEALPGVDKWSWFQHDMVQREHYQPTQPDAYYLGVKKAWQLDEIALTRLKRLCAWRERTAQVENVPRNRVVWDDHLYDFARRSRLSMSDIQGRVPRIVAQKYGDALLAVSRGEDEDALIPEPVPGPLTSAQGALVKVLRQAGLAIAQHNTMAPELISRKKDLEFCVRHFSEHGKLSNFYSTWRQGVVGETYLKILGDA